MNVYFAHPNAIVEAANIGRGTHVSAFTHILPKAIIGDECTICDHVFIENDVIIGSRVTIKSGVQLWDRITIEDDVFIGPNATFANGPCPIRDQSLIEYPRTVIHQGALIGANATLLPGIEIGRNAIVEVGAIVTRNVPPYAIVVGNPAYIAGYKSHEPAIQPDLVLPPIGPNATPIKGVRLIELPLVHDLRGDLSYGQYADQLPFIPQRYFIVFDVSSKEIRGEHAHHSLEQFLVCVKGSCAVIVDDGQTRTEFALNRPNLGLYIPPKIWGVQYNFTPEAVLLVLASDGYKSEDYIRDYEDFLKILRGG